MYWKLCSNGITESCTDDDSDFYIQPNDSDTKHVVPRYNTSENYTIYLGVTSFRDENQATSTKWTLYSSACTYGYGFQSNVVDGNDGGLNIKIETER